ncbi:MAG TPA: DUF6159 family protein [Candidatus Thalassarchaeaceae archaeon]|jgi:hypothetical protein|nr:DUF6159 family protein [Candidatus Thalassarchaeaceae archaeon]
MGFFDTIGRGWKMSKLSMVVVKHDPELMFYVALSGIFSIFAFIGMAIPELLQMSWIYDENGAMTPAYMAFIFLGYMVLSIIVTFWNSAIIANAHIRLSGGDPKFMDGISAAMKRIHIIIMWGLVAGTVGLLLKMLNTAAKNEKNPGLAILAGILHLIGATVWWMMSFFIIPHLVIEGQGIGDAMRSSKDMFFKRWGENVVSGIGIGMISGLFGLVIIVFSVGLIVLVPDLLYIWLILGAAAMTILICWTSAAEQVAVAALYLYSKNGFMPEIYQNNGMFEFKLPTADDLSQG